MTTSDVIDMVLFGAGICLGLYAIVRIVVARKQAATVHRYCRSCDHDLVGLEPDALCPECGSMKRWKNIPSVKLSRLLMWSVIAGGFCAAATLIGVSVAFGTSSIDAALFTLPFASVAPLTLVVAAPVALNGLPRHFVYLAVVLMQICGLGFAMFTVFKSATSGDAQSGLVVLALPIFHLIGSGLGLWIAYIIENPAKQLCRFKR